MQVANASTGQKESPQGKISGATARRRTAALREFESHQRPQSKPRDSKKSRVPDAAHSGYPIEENGAAPRAGAKAASIRAKLDSIENHRDSCPIRGASIVPGESLSLLMTLHGEDTAKRDIQTVFIPALPVGRFGKVDAVEWWVADKIPDASGHPAYRSLGGGFKPQVFRLRVMDAGVNQVGRFPQDLPLRDELLFMVRAMVHEYGDVWGDAYARAMVHCINACRRRGILEVTG